MALRTGNRGCTIAKLTQRTDKAAKYRLELLSGGTSRECSDRLFQLRSAEMVLYVALIAILNLALGYALAVYLHPSLSRPARQGFRFEPAYDSGGRDDERFRRQSERSEGTLAARLSNRPSRWFSTPSPPARRSPQFRRPNRPEATPRPWRSVRRFPPLRQTRRASAR